MSFTDEKYQKSNLPKITNLSKINPNQIERKKITKKSFTSNNVDIPLEKLLKPLTVTSIETGSTYHDSCLSHAVSTSEKQISS